jgi:hypothetical protein
MNKKILILFLLTLLIFIISEISKGVILGGASAINLQPASPLSNAVSQNISSLNSSKTLPLNGEEYSLSNVHYFENKNWVVATVTLKDPSPDQATVVLQKLNNTYYDVLGPGTAFSVTNLQGLPSDVSQYLSTSGVLIYTPDDN